MHRPPRHGVSGRTANPPLTPRQPDRATLGRRLLLERAKLDVVTATERIGGLQAQEPASPSGCRGASTDVSWSDSRLQLGCKVATPMVESMATRRCLG